eukprot:scaffold50939_cov58-Phaeocystis_antarctica.AAC.9
MGSWARSFFETTHGTKRLLPETRDEALEYTGLQPRVPRVAACLYTVVQPLVDPWRAPCRNDIVEERRADREDEHHPAGVTDVPGVHGAVAVDGEVGAEPRRAVVERLALEGGEDGGGGGGVDEEEYEEEAATAELGHGGRRLERP